MDNAQKRETQDPQYEENWKVARAIAKQLHETEKKPRAIIYSIVRKFGAEQAMNFLQKAEEIEAAGGLLLPDASRKRTPGGVFFHLVKTEGDREIVNYIFPYLTPKRERKRLQNQSADGSSLAVQDTNPSLTSTSTPPAKPFLWQDRIEVLDTITITERGVATTVKVTIIGRPGRVVERGQCVVVALQQQTKAPSLPKGVPFPPPDSIEPTVYTIYIATKQWKNVAEAIKDPEDALVIEGVQVLDKASPGTIAVFATTITTKKLQAAKRQVPKEPVQP
jgi:PHAX RNA-binding domain